MGWDKTEIKLDNGEFAQAHAPVIISASRSTDIPAFYADWFFHRLKIGYSAWTNPFNGVRSYVSYKNTRFIVFWSKNPRPLLDHLDELREREIGCYIQYSLNNYEKEGLEKGVRPLEERIDTFKRLVDALGLGHVIWRFDPLILTDEINADTLLERIDYIGQQLNGYTEKLVFSYADIAMYKKVKRNLEINNIHYKEWEEGEMLEFARRLSELNKKWGYTLATCGEKVDLAQYGVAHNRCIDDELIIKLAWKDPILMNFLKAEIHPMPVADLFGNMEPLLEGAIILPDNNYAVRGDNKDKGQREFCGCMKSKDIGEYNTCIHLCEYCYANTSRRFVEQNYQRHLLNPYGETITGL